MFLKTVMERNQPLVRLGIEWQQNGVILPDTYLLDYDTILENARSIKQAGDANGVQNFFMLKQIGRNPLIARALTDMGYVGADVYKRQGSVRCGNGGWTGRKCRNRRSTTPWRNCRIEVRCNVFVSRRT